MSLEKKYLALYRQYRPKKFEDVYGQEHIINTLKNIISENKITHAYLFCGPHGNGKTSTAKIFANAINCSHRTSESPCNSCIENIDQNIDIIEIDAASNTGIDDIRELKEKIKHLPTVGKYKIYIIDEVHMLSKSAFNALLKTLEEPPKHAIFILATTDPQKIPLTILSRVQRFNFKKIDKHILVKQLAYIFEKENIKASKDAIELLVTLGNGSFRDTLSIADQIAIYCANKQIEKEDIEKLFGIVDFENIWYIVKAIFENQHNLVIEKLNYLIDNGASVEKISLQIFKTLKDYAILKKTNDSNLLEYVKKEKLDELKIDDDKLFKYIEIIQNAIKDLQNSDIPKEILELYLLKMSSYKNKETEIFVKNEYKLVTNEDNIILESEATEEDFQIVNNIPEKEFKNSNHKQFNSIFNLSNISNSNPIRNNQVLNETNKELDDLGVKEVNINNILEKTSEILIAETTKEYENDDLLNEIITSEFNSDLNLEKTAQIIKPELDQEDVNSLAFIYQYIKNDLYGYGKKSSLDLDTMYYHMINQRINKQYEYLKDLLFGFKIFLSLENLIVFKSDDILKIHQFNLKRNDEDFIEAINSIFDRYVNVVAITKPQIDKAIEYCKANWKNKKNEQIQMIELPSLEKYKNKLDPNYEYAKKIFGDIVKEPKK
ncbi:DNA polymerase III subunit gamma/tau [Metamycoplasma canadense]|uniref:DNA polymerase III subunit gamma/tau n=1 Tax=Metamycoplasma canadense TaxID=29554 RepID=A0A077L6Q0_9BACT|nr:DNA polymerase III subunit gamma/tau [Metamycoplasma canadense]BAP39657.1 DNA polymerase III subunit gamma and tau [Metamycoplasma canadense]